MKKHNELYLNLSQKIQNCIENKIYEFYDIEKQNSVVFMPLFSFLLQGGGNHIQPMITYSERFACTATSDDFKSVYIFPGYYRDIEDITQERYENILGIVSLYQRLYKNSISHNSTKETEFNNFLHFSEQAKAENNNIINHDIFDNFYKIYSIGLNETLTKIKEILLSEDKNIKPIVILPRDDVFRTNYSNVYNEDCTFLTKQNIEELKLFEKEYTAKIFLASNNAGRDSHCEGVALRLYETIFENPFPIVKSLDDFYTIYSKILIDEFKQATTFDELIVDIYNGNYGTTETEIIENIKNIKLNNQTNQPYLKKYNNL